MWINKLIAGIKAWFTPPAKSDQVDPKFAHLQHIEAEELAKKFRLRDEGRRLGEAGVPPVDASSLSGPEASAINEVEKARREYQNWAVRRLTSLDEAISACDIRHEINTALVSEQVFINKVANYLTAEDHELRQAKKELEEERSQLERFKKDNKLWREAQSPSSSGKLLGYALLCLMVLIEGIVNGQIFQKGLAGGALEGMIYAGLFALFNVIVAFWLGAKGFRFTNHVKTLPKVLGWLSLLGTLTVASSLGLMLGHFRVALSDQVEQASEVAWQSFISSPLNIGGIDSVILFGITIVFGLAAFFDGYRMDDVYPGYGSQRRRYDEALANYNDEVGLIQEELNEFKIQAIQDLDRAVQRSQAVLANLNAEIINKNAAYKRITVALDTSQAAANAAVQIFRADNLKARRERGFNDYPPYFNSNPELTKIDIPNFDVRADKEIAKEMSELVTKLIANAQDIRRKIEEAFNAQYNQLIPLIGQFNGEKDGKIS